MQSYSIPGRVSGMREPYEVDLYVNLEGEKNTYQFCAIKSLHIVFILHPLLFPSVLLLK